MLDDRAAGPGDVEKTPVFDRADLAPKSDQSSRAIGTASHCPIVSLAATGADHVALARYDGG